MLANNDKALFASGLMALFLYPMNQDRFLALTDWARQQMQLPELQLSLISGDASFRRYYRAAGRIWVDAPPATEKNAEFVTNAAALGAAGVIAPQVFAVDLAHGWLSLSDLGDTLLLGCLQGDTVRHWYGKAIALLPQLARVRLSLPTFDAEFMARENSIFPEWLLEKHLGLSLSVADRALLAQSFAVLTDNNQAQPQVGMHRDFHSRNLMVQADGSLAVIDFQDMVRGPLTYDLVSLLKDCYIRWPESLVSELIQQGHAEYQQAGLCQGFTATEFRRALDLTGMQRHLKAAGIFCRLQHRDGKPGYLKDIPRTLYYVQQVASRTPELMALADWLAQRVMPHFVYEPTAGEPACAP